jgi:mono/diheme cytochrome c family protein
MTPMPRLPFRFVAAALAAALAMPLAAPAAEDVFAFIPSGGRTLLADVLGAKATPDEVRALLGGKRTRDEWLKYLREHAKQLPGVQRLKDKELRTLAEYLASNMPLPANRVPADLARANWEKSLPPDGKDFTLDYCQGCHIVTVVVTQDRSREAWLGTLGKPSHVRIKLDRGQREALVNYLLINAAIPIDEVPEDLRAGGATY